MPDSAVGESGLRTFSVPGPADGPVFVLLHGIGLSHREFTRLARVLSHVGRVISFDLPGFGSSPTPSRNLSVQDHAAIVSRKLETLGLGPVVVVGHSMGVQTAVELARQSPAAVDRVVLIGPVVDPAKPTLRWQAAALMRDSPLEPPKTQAMVLSDYVRCSVPWFFAQAVVMRDYPLLRMVAEVAQPVLVIRGANDPIADAAWCRSLARHAPDGRAVNIVGKRHNVPHSDPEATAAAILDFV
jgi:pimeloyl-ACP methyl ester carboxylesterase